MFWMNHIHIINIELDQTRYIAETRDHKSVDSEVARLLSRICAFYEERHAIMDCLFVPFHIRAGIARHVELQNVVRTLMDQSQE